ncbi:hypothetical protein DH09_19760 [Bacillaceae bacterium JMAK1]|nr:hypothetical protein DH09_19760 [Bacillaceae bacterium JMAK1]
MASSKDVAKRAGVSQPTVSRVINGSTNVNKATIEKVRRAMEELNYRPNLIARSLKQQKTKSIALISGALHNPFFVDSTTTIVNVANAHGYRTLVYFEEQGNNEAVYEEVLKQQVDGIVLSSIFIDDPVFKELEHSKIPFVMFNRRHQAGGNFVEIDNEQAGALAANHLLELGHSKIAWIGGPTNCSTFDGRLLGYKKALGELGKAAWIKETDTTESDVITAVDQLLALEEPPTAIFAATDAMALSCQSYLMNKGYRIPEDMSICGMDDIPMSRHAAIQLTTVTHEELKPMGQFAVEHLLHLIDSPKEVRGSMQVTLKPKLIARHSSGMKN